MAGLRAGALAALGLLALSGTDLAAEPASPQGNPSCVAFVAEARYRGIGYEHWVHIANACAKAANCRVTTNVNPDVLEARVDSGTRTTVITYRGSPASSFLANVQCVLER